MSTGAAYSKTGATAALQTEHAEDLQGLLTVEDVAAVLKVSPSWVYEHTRSRGTPRAERLPHIRIGKYVRFDPRAIRTFLEKKICQPK
jgi:predicted DNA-binding transcriptional regulator AlpA